MSNARPSPSLLDHFSALSDPRQRWRVLYPLPEILLLVLCATLSGMEDFVEIELWGEQRLDFLQRFLPYERGIPAHDTLNDVINGLDAELFKTCFANWVEALREHAPDIIAIDGKTSRRTHARRSSMPRPLRPPSAPIGASRTGSTGFSTSSSTTILHGYAPATGRKTWPSSNTWP